MWPRGVWHDCRSSTRLPLNFVAGHLASAMDGCGSHACIIALKKGVRRESQVQASSSAIALHTSSICSSVSVGPDGSRTPDAEIFSAIGYLLDCLYGGIVCSGWKIGLVSIPFAGKICLSSKAYAHRRSQLHQSTMNKVDYIKKLSNITASFKYFTVYE